MNMTELVAAANELKEHGNAKAPQKKQELPQKSKEQWREERIAEMQEIWGLMDAQTSKAFLSADALDRHLRTQARLGDMGAANVLLAESQRPDASEIRTFDEWKKLDASIIAGEKAIRILSPAQVSKDGEEKTYFNIKKVFDISQTSLSNERYSGRRVTAGDAQALIQSAPVKTVINDGLPEQFSARYNSAGDVIELRSDIDGNGISELARPVVAAYRKARGKEADSYVTTMAAAILAYRIDPNAQMPKEELALCVSHMTPNEPAELRASLTEAKRTSREVYSQYRDALKELQRENKRSKAQER